MSQGLRQATELPKRSVDVVSLPKLEVLLARRLLTLRGGKATEGSKLAAALDLSWKPQPGRWVGRCPSCGEVGTSCRFAVEDSGRFCWQIPKLRKWKVPSCPGCGTKRICVQAERSCRCDGDRFWIQRDDNRFCRSCGSREWTQVQEESHYACKRGCPVPLDESGHPAGLDDSDAWDIRDNGRAVCYVCGALPALVKGAVHKVCDGCGGDDLVKLKVRVTCAGCGAAVPSPAAKQWAMSEANARRVQAMAERLRETTREAKGAAL